MQVASGSAERVEPTCRSEFSFPLSFVLAVLRTFGHSLHEDPHEKLPPQAHPDHLKKQAKALLRLYRQGDADAVARFVRFLLPPRTARTTKRSRSGFGCMTRNRASRASTALRHGPISARSSKRMRWRGNSARGWFGAGSTWRTAAT